MVKEEKEIIEELKRMNHSFSEWLRETETENDNDGKLSYRERYQSSQDESIE